MKIQELMTNDVRVCQPSDNLSSAAQAMWEGDIGCLPVVDGEGKLVGMITDRDICMAAHLRGAPLWSVAVGDAMAKVVYSCRPEHKLDDVLELCGEKRIRRVPVVDGDGKLTGLVTLSGLAQAVNGEAKSKPNVSAKDICRTLSAVTSRRETPVEARLVVEVQRGDLSAKGTLTPTPRPSAGASTAAPAKKAEKSAQKLPKKSRSGR